MNVIFKLSLAMLIAVAIMAFAVLMYLVFAGDPAYVKYAVAKQASLIIIPSSFISLMFTCFTCDKAKPTY
jgi:hypothetical protein